MSNTFTWNTTNGDWSIGSNWTDITSITPGPPTGADVADFFNLSGTIGSAGTITGTGTAAVVNFVGTPVWTLAGNFSTNQGFVAPGAGTTADVEVQSGVWTLSNGIHVGQQGAGTVTVYSGATISTGGTFNVVGDVAGSTGELVINSGGTFVSTAPSVSGKNSIHQSFCAMRNCFRGAPRRNMDLLAFHSPMRAVRTRLASSLMMS